MRVARALAAASRVALLARVRLVRSAVVRRHVVVLWGVPRVVARAASPLPL